MKKKNILDINKFLLDNDENKEYNKNFNMINKELNQKINLSPKINNNKIKSNSRYIKDNNSSVKKKSPNKNKQIYNKNYMDIIRYTEEELSSLDSEKHIKSAIKILETFQNELIGQLEQEYDENSIKKILQINFDKIIKLLIKYFTLYDNKCSNCVEYLKKMLTNLFSIDNTNKYNNSALINSDGKIANKSYKNTYTPIFNEEKKKEFLNGEEIIVGLINSLSGGIKNCNKNYRTTVYNMAKLIEESNNSLIEIKTKLDNLNSKINTKISNETQYKKSLSVSVLNIITEVQNLYSMNFTIIEDVKVIDVNQTSFYEEAKEIFNHLKINHNKKLKEYHMFFESISHLQTNANSLTEIKKRGNSFSGNRINYERISNNTEKNLVKNNSSKKVNTKNNYKEYNDNIYKNINLTSLAEQIIDLFNKMKNLQECIVKKIEGTNQLKIDFEKDKRKLIKLANYIINNKIKSNSINLIKQRKDDETKKIINFEIQQEYFEIISEMKIDNKTFEISEMQMKYNNLLEEINKKSQEINKLQDKINNIQLENNELKRSDNNKFSNNINFDEINKINEEINEIKNIIKNNSLDFEKKVKNFLSKDEIKVEINNIQKKYEKIITDIFEYFLQYKNYSNDKEYLTLQIPIKNYNSMIENNMSNLSLITQSIESWNIFINNDLNENNNNFFQEIINMTTINNNLEYNNTNDLINSFEENENENETGDERNDNVDNVNVNKNNSERKINEENEENENENESQYTLDNKE